MIHINKENESEAIIMTLSENSALPTSYYTLVFTDSVSRDTVFYWLNPDDDMSDYPNRFNKYSISTTPFNNKNPGQWFYDVYEHDGSHDQSEDISGLKNVETGKMKLTGTQTNFIGEQTGTKYVGPARG